MYIEKVTPEYLQEQVNRAKYDVGRLKESLDWLHFFQVQLSKAGITLDEHDRLGFSSKAILRAEEKHVEKAEQAIASAKAGKKVCLERYWDSLKSQKYRIEDLVTRIEYLRYTIEDEYGDVAMRCALLAKADWLEHGGTPIMVASLDDPSPNPVFRPDNDFL